MSDGEKLVKNSDNENMAVKVTSTSEKKDKSKLEKDELSEEDRLLKEGLELAVQRLEEPDTSLHQLALDHLIGEIRSSTSSMTAVPKPLKFLRPFYDKLKSIYQTWEESHELKKKLADVLSVLAMTMASQGTRESLKFKLQGTSVDISSWGHEYVRSLAGEISEEYNNRMLEAANSEPNMEDLMHLVDDILPFQMQHNAEAEAVDLLVEVQKLNKLIDLPVVDDRNYSRVCLYLIRCADFMSDPEDLIVLFETAFALYKKQGKFTDALRIAIKMDNEDKIRNLFSNETGASDIVRKQMAFILARHRSHYADCDDEDINNIIGNTQLSENFLNIARSMDVIEPKKPEDIYKTHLISGTGRRTVSLFGSNLATNTVAETARGNLASSFVNGFVNAAFNKDKLMMGDDTSLSAISSSIDTWVFKNKDHGMLSAVASLGLIYLWNVDEGFNQIDRYFHHPDNNIKAGACLGAGLLSCGVRNEADSALAILSEYLDNTSHLVRLSAIMGLGIAYSGTRKDDLMDLLIPIIANADESTSNIIEVSFASLSLGLSFVGTCDDEISGTILQRIMEASSKELDSHEIKFLCLGLALIYLGKTDRVDAVLEASRAIDHKVSKYLEIMLETLAYAGTGNVLKIQQLLHICAEHLTENAEHQVVATLGIALISLGEDISTEMTLRTFEHLQHYCELQVKRVIPLALSLLYISNPDYSVIDQLSRLSHDQDNEIAQGAILGLGLVSAGTNNSRVAGLLRQLSDFYAKESNHLFIVRLAQGLNAMAKGLIGLSPFHSDR